MYCCITNTQISLRDTSSSGDGALLLVYSQYFLPRPIYASDLPPQISFAFSFPPSKLYLLYLLAQDPSKPPPLPRVRVPPALHPRSRLSPSPRPQWPRTSSGGPCRPVATGLSGAITLVSPATHMHQQSKLGFSRNPSLERAGGFLPKRHAQTLVCGWGRAGRRNLKWPLRGHHEFTRCRVARWVAPCRGLRPVRAAGSRASQAGSRFPGPLRARARPGFTSAGHSAEAPAPSR